MAAGETIFIAETRRRGEMRNSKPELAEVVEHVGWGV
jgi:hypothetical protein